MTTRLRRVGFVMPPREHEAGHSLRRVDLNEVASRRQQRQLVVREEGREATGHRRAEIAVTRAEDDPHGRDERTQPLHLAPTAEYRAEQVVVESPERRPG